MKHFPSDKYNLAWFKLAECVTRGEKERALAVYRLLSHSINDRAYALQLEADILLAFNDELALQKYQAATTLYSKEGRKREAAAVGEHIITLQPQSPEILELLLSFYATEHYPAKTIEYLILISEYYLACNDFDSFNLFLDRYANTLNINDKIILYKEIIKRYIKVPQAPFQQGVALLQLVLNFMLDGSDSSEMQQFLITLENVHVAYYQEAIKILN